MSRLKILENWHKLGGPGSGNRGHSGGQGGPGNPGGSKPRLAKKVSTWEIEKAAMNSVLAAANITQKDAEGIRRYSTTPPQGYTDVGKSWRKDGTDEHYAGFYDYESNTVFVHPSHINTSTVIHEIGHHIVGRELGIPGTEEFDRNTRGLQMRLRSFKHTILEPTMATYGLRPYSFSKPDEFFADAFKVLKLGTPSQKERLRELSGNLRVDLKEIFGE